MSSGSVRTFRSQRTLATSSTTQTDVSSTETSKPTKCAIAAAPSQMLEVRPIPDPIIVCEGAARSSLEGLGAAAAIHHVSGMWPLKAVVPFTADAVEKVRWWERQTGRRGTAGRCRGSGWHGVHGEWNKLGELAEVLGCSGEVELVTGAVRPA